MKIFILFITALILSSASPLSFADIVVIVNAQSNVSELDSDTVSDIFLGKVSRFPDGSSVKPLELSSDNSEKEAFHSAVTGKSLSRLKVYWSKLIFSGKGEMPEELSSSAEVKNQVASNPNKIGYIDSANVDGSVKVIFSL